MGWLVFWGVVLLVLAVIAFVPGRRRRGSWLRSEANEPQLREGFRAGGMQSGWGTHFGGGHGDGGGGA